MCKLAGLLEPGGIPPHKFWRGHTLCVWLVATVQRITLVRAVQILFKDSDILQAGRYLLELVGLDTQVVVTNVISVNPSSIGNKDKGGKLKYLIQFMPRALVLDPSQCASMVAYLEEAIAYCNRS